MRLFKPKTDPEAERHSILSLLLGFAVRAKAEEIIFEPHAEEADITVVFHKIDGVKHISTGLPNHVVDWICDSLKTLAKSYDPETHEGRVEVRMRDETGYIHFNYGFDFTLHPTPARPQGNPHIVFDSISFFL